MNGSQLFLLILSGAVVSALIIGEVAKMKLKEDAMKFNEWFKELTDIQREIQRKYYASSRKN